MNQKEFERWRAIREKGLLHYYLTWGVLRRALPVTLLMVLINHLRSEGLRLPESTLLDVSTSILATVVTAGVVGVFWALLSWYGAEGEFLEYEQRERERASKHSESGGSSEAAKLA